jgi:hypothetical protein
MDSGVNRDVGDDDCGDACELVHQIVYCQEGQCQT